jgi:hypothetical protein
MAMCSCTTTRYLPSPVNVNIGHPPVVYNQPPMFHGYAHQCHQRVERVHYRVPTYPDYPPYRSDSRSAYYCNY